MSSNPPIVFPRSILDISSEVTRLIQNLAVDDVSWGEYPPPVVGYRDSPLSDAISISHVCKKWRTEILADQALWGRLLNTLHYPTFNNSLWSLVYSRAGNKPIWLSHFDRTSRDGTLRRLSERQMFSYRNMFQWAVSNITPGRIQRLELDGSTQVLAGIPYELTSKMLDAVAHHTTHLSLGNSLYASALTGNLPADPKVARIILQLGHALSRKLIATTFGGSTLKHMALSGGHRPLRQLRMQAISIDVEELLLIMSTSGMLEEVSLSISSPPEPVNGGAPQSVYANVIYLGRRPQPIRQSIIPQGAVISLPRLCSFQLHSPLGLEESPEANVGENPPFHFSVVGKFSKYFCCRSKALYTIQRVERLVPE